MQKGPAYIVTAAVALTAIAGTLLLRSNAAVRISLAAQRTARAPTADAVTPPAERVGGARITLHNNMPCVVHVLTYPDLKRHRSPWGGGPLPLGHAPISGFRLICSDSIWTYAFDVSCPTGDEHYTIRLSDLWHGRLPPDFRFRRGRPTETGEIIWFDNP